MKIISERHVTDEVYVQMYVVNVNPCSLSFKGIYLVVLMLLAVIREVLYMTDKLNTVTSEPRAREADHDALGNISGYSLSYKDILSPKNGNLLFMHHPQVIQEAGDFSSEQKRRFEPKLVIFGDSYHANQWLPAL